MDAFGDQKCIYCYEMWQKVIVHSIIVSFMRLTHNI